MIARLNAASPIKLILRFRLYHICAKIVLMIKQSCKVPVGYISWSTDTLNQPIKGCFLSGAPGRTYSQRTFGAWLTLQTCFSPATLKLRRTLLRLSSSSRWLPPPEAEGVGWYPRGRTQTDTSLRTQDFESSAPTG
jgi:hypothetical protein